MSPQPSKDTVPVFTISDLHTKTCIPTAADAKKQLYAAWAPAYEQDVNTNSYPAPHTMAEYAMRFILKLFPASQRLAILDAGCGTGLVIEELHPSLKKAKFAATITGLDFSSDMLKLAQDKSIYNKLLQANLDLPLPVQEDSVDVAVCCGVFVPGHCGLLALSNITRCLKVGGIFVFSLRDATYDEDGAEYIRITKESGCEVIGDFVRPYLGPIKAHYLVAQRKV